MFDFNSEKVLRENGAKVIWNDKVVDIITDEVLSDPFPGWNLVWKNGTIFIGNCSEHIAREVAAIFVHLWLNGISAQMADHLIQAYAHIDRWRKAVETLVQEKQQMANHLVQAYAHIDCYREVVTTLLQERQQATFDSTPTRCSNCDTRQCKGL
jgi:hypothetical protein